MWPFQTNRPTTRDLILLFGKSQREHQARTEGHLMTISNNVQAIIRQVAETKSIEQAAMTALGTIAQQTAEMQTQIADLKAKLGASDEDMAALVQAATDLHDSATQLQAAVPANTTPAPSDTVSSSDSSPPPAGDGSDALDR